MKIKYDLKNLRGDLLGGLIAGIVALPLALAFGVQSGLGAHAGLYGAIATGILAALLGGTATQVTGPTGPMTVVSASVVAIAIERTRQRGERAGDHSPHLLPGRRLPGPVWHPRRRQVCQVLSLPGDLGLYERRRADHRRPANLAVPGLSFTEIDHRGLHPHRRTAGNHQLGGGRPRGADGAHLLSLAAHHQGRAQPSSRCWWARWQSVLLGLDVPVIGDIPSGLPALTINAMFSVTPSDYLIVLEFALILAMLGSIDSLLTSVIADNITKTKHNSNRELIGQGIGNMAAALIGGIPGAGATKGTVVNINAGGKTRLSGALHGLFLLIVLLGAGQYAALVPLSVLAGILIPIGLGIVDYKGIRDLRYVPRADAAVLIVVLLVTVFGDLLQAVGVGIVLASVLYMKQSSDLAEARTSVTPLTTQR